MPATTRYAALLRGVSPMNCRMPALKSAFEAAGFDDVRTVLASGNVLFSAPRAAPVKVERACEAAMEKHLGSAFSTFVRPVDALRELLEADPFAAFRLAKGSKRVVTFVRAAPAQKLALPITLHDARILAVRGTEVLSAYVPGPRGPVFMTLIEKTFGKDVTTRTWDTVAKLAR
jgi:uncharacterized protein (DUF1697 family)